MNIKNRVYRTTILILLLASPIVYFFNEDMIAFTLGAVFLLLFFKEEIYSFLSNVGVHDGKTH